MFGAIGSAAVWALFNPGPGRSRVFVVKLFLIGVAAPVSGWNAIKSFQKAIQAREARKELERQGITDN